MIHTRCERNGRIQQAKSGRTVNREPDILRSMNTLRDIRGVDDTPMTKTYMGVMILEAAILVLLWLFGRAFS